MKERQALPDTVAPAPPASLMQEVEGTVLGHRDGHGFVRPDDGSPDLYLAPAEMRQVLHLDRVRVRVVRLDRKGRPEARVLDIVDRRRGPVIGRLLQEQGVWIVAPEDRRFGRDILMARQGLGDAKAGQVVVVELTEAPALGVQPVGRVTEVLGDIDDPGMEIEIAVRKFGVPHLFDAATEAEAAALPSVVRPQDMADRIDLRDVPLVTIDGIDARDFDDAVYAEPFSKGRGKSARRGWRLVVAIADVSAYVQPGRPLDVDAYERATSVYFPRRVIPMLPEKLSNGLCSLNPDVDRLCMVCDMVVDTDGEITAYQFFPGVMRSHARLTYEEVAAILANTKGLEAKRRADRVPQLIDLHDCYRALLKARSRRGAMDFETTETQIVTDEHGRIEKIVPRVRTEAHRLIEEAMLAANVCAADVVERHKHPALYRVHEGPTPEKQVALQAYFRALGIGVALSDEPTPAQMQAIADQVRERPDAAQIHSMLLRSMQQAIYTPVNSGHFGLAYGAYAHFTSPIRRYPDLLLHRVLKALIASERYHLALPDVKQPPTAPPRRAAKPLSRAGVAAPAAKRDAPPRTRLSPAEQAAWEGAGVHCSGCERRADEASRDVEAWLKCRYMRGHLGEVYAGAVTAVTSFGLFVTLDALHVEGLVHITELGGEYYRFDEVRQELRGERTGMRYAIGTRIDVQVIRVDLDARKIDFRLVRDDEDAALRERIRRQAKAAPGAEADAPPARASDALRDVRERDRQGKKDAKSARGRAAKSAGKAASARRKPTEAAAAEPAPTTAPAPAASAAERGRTKARAAQGRDRERRAKKAARG